MISKNIYKTFLYVANSYIDDDRVLCNMVTFKQFEDEENCINKKIFNFKFYFNCDVELDMMDDSTLTTYNSKLVGLIKHLKRCVNEFKNDSYGWYIIDSIIDYIKELFDRDAFFDSADIMLIDTIFDEIHFKYDRINVVYPKDLNDTENPNVIIEFKYSADNNEFIKSIYINDRSFRVEYTDEHCHKLTSNTLDTFILPVLDILSSRSDYMFDKVVNYLIPHLILNAADFEFKLS